MKLFILYPLLYRSLKLLFAAFIFLLLIFFTLIFYNQESIVHPSKRALQPYHYEWLQNPQAHSMKIIKDENRRDILIVKRDENVSLSKRSQKIRDNLNTFGYRENLLKNRGVMLMYHGKNGRKEDLLPVAERYITAGFTCILIDLPAHGDSPNTTCYYGQNEEKKFFKNILNTIEKHIDIEQRPLYVWGMSLGGAYAIRLAQTHSEVNALILLSTFDNFSYILNEKSISLFGEQIGNLLYNSLVFSLKVFYQFEPNKVDSSLLAQSIDIPVFMLHGKQDKLITYHHGKALFGHFKSKEKVFHLDKKGNHHNILVTDYPFYLKSTLFLLEH